MNNFIWQFSQNQPLPLLNQLWISQEEIDNNVRNRIEQEKANTYPEEDFFNDVKIFQADNSVDNSTAVLETLKYYKNKGYSIEWINIDNEISILEKEQYNIKRQETQQKIEEAKINKKAEKIEKEAWFIETWDRWVLWTISDFFKFWQWYLESEWKQWLISETMWGISQSVEETRQIEAWAEIWIKEWILNTAEWLMWISGSLWISDWEWKKALKEFNIESSEKMAKAMDVDAEWTYENIWNALWKFWLALAPIPWTSKIEITNKAWKVLWTWTKWALEWLKWEAIFEWEMTTEWIAYWIGIPVAFKALWWAFKWVKALWPWIKKFLAKKYPWLPTRLIDDIDNNPELINKLLKWEIKSWDLYKELTKRFPDENITMDSVKKLRQDFAALYDDIIAKWKVSEDWILDMATQRLDELKELRKTKWATIWWFKWKQIATTIDKLDELVQKTKKWLKRWTVADDVISDVEKEMKSVLWWLDDITTDDLLTLSQNLKDKAFSAWKWKYSDLMKQYSKVIEWVADDALWAEYKAAKEAFRKTMLEIDDFNQVLLNKTTWTVKENLRSQIQSLKNPNNKEKLKSLAKAFWEENEQKFLQYLDDVFKWWEAEKVVQKVTKAEDVTNLLKWIKSWKQWLWFNTRDKEFLLKRLEEIKSQQFKGNIIKKLPVDDQWNLRIWDISDSLIGNIAKADTKLADDIRIAKSISNLWRDVWLSWWMSPISFDFWASMLFRDAKSVTQWLVNYELAKKWTAWLSTKIIEWLRKWTWLSSDEATLLKEYLVKVSVMWNIENDIYEWIPETLISK